MPAPLQRLLAALLLACAGATAALGRQEYSIAVEQPGIEIRATCPFSPLPASGYAPIEITIKNATDRPGAWRFLFQQSSALAYQNSWSDVESLAVEAHAERTFKLLVPLASPASDSQPLGLTVEGTGIDIASNASFSVGQKLQLNAPAPPFLGVRESLLTEGLRQAAGPASVTAVSPAELPEDWRALFGFDSLWLLESDLSGLTAGQRGALREWEARGGMLHLFDADGVPPELAATGFGQVKTHHAGWNDVQIVKSLPTSRLRWFEPSALASWPSAEHVGLVRPNLPLLVVLLIALAVAIGPINLFVLAGPGRRARILWTTPSISLVASAALVVLILLQDGVGGWGERSAIIQILPGESQAAVWQEQASRTGVLFSSGFHLANPSVLTPINSGPRSDRTPREFRSRGLDYTGSWFASRSRQTYFLETIIPTRAEVQLLDATAPVVVSSIDMVLDEISVRTADGRYWRGENLRAGEKQRLQPAEHPPAALLPDAGPRLRGALEEALARKGGFCAVTRDARAFQATLPALRWTTQRAVFTGLVTPTAP